VDDRLVLIQEVFDANGGVATREQLLATMNPKTLARHVAAGAIVRVWHGVYGLVEPDLPGRLAALELAVGRPIVACMHTAATLYGFDNDDTTRVHVLDPGVRVRPNSSLMVHQRLDAPLKRIHGRLATAPAWTAVEVSRTQWRPRALATLDAALRSETCDRAGLAAAVTEQKGRRGIVKVRELLPLADSRAESAMESMARMVMLDGGLPMPELQYEIVDLEGRLWRVDFAWPEHRIVAEYDSVAWHSGPEAMLSDRIRTAALQDCRWMVVPIVAQDIYREPIGFVARMRSHLDRRAA
jgi:very-short-patch-repair endonuclease